MALGNRKEVIEIIFCFRSSNTSGEKLRSITITTLCVAIPIKKIFIQLFVRT